MRFPSIQSLKSVLHNSIGMDAIRLARKIGKADRAGILTLSSDAMNWHCKAFRPGTSYLRLLALNQALEMHGIEYLRSTGGEYAEYLNTGDMYFPTIIRWRGNYRVQSIGDFIETMERRGVRFE